MPKIRYRNALLSGIAVLASSWPIATALCADRSGQAKPALPVVCVAGCGERPPKIVQVMTPLPTFPLPKPRSKAPYEAFHGVYCGHDHGCWTDVPKHWRAHWPDRHHRISVHVFRH